MCGIAGVFDPAAVSSLNLLDVAGRMADRLRHRGPDEGRAWHDPATGIALGHRRLSVLDLSPAGRQPMTSACGRFTVVYNGEIYNHAGMRADLAAAGGAFRGHSDTEVLVEAIARWGVRSAIERSHGMFAFAVWDARERTLTLARDRLGIKPLYYGWQAGQFIFASELKAFFTLEGFHPEIDRDAVAQLLQHSYIPAPHTIYRGLFKLPPGCTLTVGPGPPQPQTPQPYWTLSSAIESGRAAPFRGSAADAAEQLEVLLAESVARERVADVPVGAFLSGGIDSTAVVALLAAQRAGVRSFTIGFAEPEFDEIRHAEAIARHLHVEHVVLRMTSDEARAVIPRLPEIYDEPFADSSQIPTLLVSQLARRDVTVSLSGDGGDELFGGYDRYARLGRTWKQIAWLPANVRKLAGQLYERVIQRGLRGRSRPSWRGRVLLATDERALYEELNRHWERPEEIVLGAKAMESSAGSRSLPATFLEQMMSQDTVTYLPDCILTKLDRASMAVSLEARVPLLDHRIVEFAWTLPPDYKVRGGVTKWPLREVLARHLPRELFQRPKRGFGVPMGQWLRGPLREWAEDLLAEDRLAQQGYLHPAPIRERWHEHLAGRANWEYLLWDVLMFQAWLDRPARASA